MSDERKNDDLDIDLGAEPLQEEMIPVSKVNELIDARLKEFASNKVEQLNAEKSAAKGIDRPNGVVDGIERLIERMGQQQGGGRIPYNIKNRVAEEKFYIANKHREFIGNEEFPDFSFRHPDPNEKGYFFQWDKNVRVTIGREDKLQAYCAWTSFDGEAIEMLKKHPLYKVKAIVSEKELTDNMVNAGHISYRMLEFERVARLSHSQMMQEANKYGIPPSMDQKELHLRIVEHLAKQHEARDRRLESEYAQQSEKVEAMRPGMGGVRRAEDMIQSSTT